jgi:hypothetical protein
MRKPPSFTLRKGGLVRWFSLDRFCSVFFYSNSNSSCLFHILVPPALGPPKKERGVKAALETDRAEEEYCSSDLLQPRNQPRRCAACGCRVTNGNLGGFVGHSALSGSLFCYHCADLQPRLLVGF